MAIFDDLRISIAAVRLKALAQTPTENQLVEAFDLLAEFSTDERQAIGAKAVELGADPAAVQVLLKLVEGEVIEVTGKPPSAKRAWWPLVLGGAAGLTAGAYAFAKLGKRSL